MSLEMNQLLYLACFNPNNPSGHFEYLVQILRNKLSGYIRISQFYRRSTSCFLLHFEKKYMSGLPKATTETKLNKPEQDIFRRDSQGQKAGVQDYIQQRSLCRKVKKDSKWTSAVSRASSELSTSVRVIRTGVCGLDHPGSCVQDVHKLLVHLE